ncbi:long-chain-fatty-acid-CoA ligase [Thraustotheca clavata]|uniref:Long-chain-fatty-acid-CoA ligase n=1 Tax=Thraustotheca clavata TaxID=74557 RepID=A0A1W0AA37_9STRA|nr:long-chain-fatty-acid-CoA ligase [Thraustotheca clavata]
MTTEKPLRAWEAHVEVALRMTETGYGAAAPITICDELAKTVQRDGDKPAHRIKKDGVWTSKTWSQLNSEVESFAKSLIHLGLTPFEAVGIIGFNASEWIIANLGAIMAGTLSAGIYTTSNPDACFYIANHSEAPVIVCDGVTQLEKFVSIADRLPKLKALVIYNDVVPADLKCKVPVYAFDDFLKLGVDVDNAILAERIANQKPGNCSTLIYTSGTTGNPKAVMLSHDNITWTVYSTVQTYGRVGVHFSNNESLVSFLPLSHIAAQLFDIYLPIMSGVQIWFAQPDALKGSLGTTLKEVRPSFFFAVPRVWEKMMEKMLSVSASTTGIKKSIVTWCKDIGLRKNQLAQFGQSGGVPCGYTVAERLLFSKVRDALGLDRCMVFASGAAPISNDTINFFMGLDMPIYEFFGQSETTGPTLLCLKEQWKIGTVGLELEGTKMKIVEETQELVYQGRNTMMGYLKQEDVTKESIDDEGWLHSGDCGKVDEDNFCTITGRIKELIITAGGENIPPVLLEDAVKEELPVLSNVMAIGDRRKFLTAIFTFRVTHDSEGNPTDKIEPGALAIIQSLGSTATTVAEARDCEKVNAYLQAGLKKANSKAASRAQHIQKYHIIDHDFSVNGDELTATLKLKRRIVVQKYGDIIEAMYA